MGSPHPDSQGDSFRHRPAVFDWTMEYFFLMPCFEGDCRLYFYLIELHGMQQALHIKIPYHTVQKFFDALNIIPI